jgi:ankyrin repeat protein
VKKRKIERSSESDKEKDKTFIHSSQNKESLVIKTLKSNFKKSKNCDDKDLVNVLAMESIKQYKSSGLFKEAQDKNFNPNFCDKDGNSLLHVAVKFENQNSSVELLLNKKANIDLKNKEEKTPKQVAQNLGLVEIVELLDNYFDEEEYSATPPLLEEVQVSEGVEAINLEVDKEVIVIGDDN